MGEERYGVGAKVREGVRDARAPERQIVYLRAKPEFLRRDPVVLRQNALRDERRHGQKVRS